MALLLLLTLLLLLLLAVGAQPGDVGEFARLAKTWAHPLTAGPAPFEILWGCHRRSSYSFLEIVDSHVPVPCAVVPIRLSARSWRNRSSVAFRVSVSSILYAVATAAWSSPTRRGSCRSSQINAAVELRRNTRSVSTSSTTDSSESGTQGVPTDACTTAPSVRLTSVPGSICVMPPAPVPRLGAPQGCRALSSTN